MNQEAKLHSWPGARITGTEGTKILSYFSQEADAKCVNDINNRFKCNYEHFKPWMSRSDSYEVLHELDNIERVNYLTNQIGLELLRKSLKMGEGFNLKAVDPNAQENVSILQFGNEEHLRFESYVLKYFDICNKIDSCWKSRLTFLISEINPMTSEDNENRLRTDGSGLSSLLYRKALFLSLPKESPHSFFEFALNLSHEIGHQALMVYEYADDIVKVDQYTTSYSIIRKTHRPAIQCFHALCATVYMLEFIIYANHLLRQEFDLVYIKNRSSQLQSDLNEGLKEIQDIPLTSLGNQIISEFTAFSIWSQRALNV